MGGVLVDFSDLDGLVIPVIRDADRKGIATLAEEMAELSKLARAGKLSPAQMQGGCFSISSLGGIGGGHFTPIINAPEVAILGVGRAISACRHHRQHSSYLRSVGQIQRKGISCNVQ